MLSAAVSKRAQQVRRWVLQYYPHLTDEEVEEERAEVTCPRAPSYLHSATKFRGIWL